MEGYLLNSNNEKFLYERVKEIIENETGYEIHPNVALIDLVKNKKDLFTKDEWNFIQRASRVDIVVTASIDRRKIKFVFESDSKYHDTKEQKRRDSLKNSILKKSGIPFMRFRPELHYVPNQFNETFIDAVLLSISNQEFVKALCREAWEEVLTTESKSDHPVFLVLPYQREYKNLEILTEETTKTKNEELGLLKGREWEENEEICYNEQILLKEDGNVFKQLTSATGRCSEQEFLYGAYAVAEHFAIMGCLYKYLVNNKIIKPEKRPFLNFLI